MVTDRVVAIEPCASGPRSRSGAAALVAIVACARGPRVGPGAAALIAIVACARPPTVLPPPPVGSAGPDRAAAEFVLLDDVPGIAPPDLRRIAGGGVGFIAAERRLATATVGAVALVEPAQTADWLCIGADGRRTVVVDDEAVYQTSEFGGARERLGTLRDYFGSDAVMFERDGQVEIAGCTPEGAWPRPPRVDLFAARFVTAELIAAPGEDDGALAVLDLAQRDPSLRAWQAIESPRDCEPASNRQAVYRCREGGRSVMVRVDADGMAREELAVIDDPERNDLRDSIDVAAPADAMSGDGGVALLGSCDGSRRQAACVRRGDGTWHTIAAPSSLIAAMVTYHPFEPDYGPRGAPPTLVPTPAGELYAVFTPKRDRDQRAIARVGDGVAIEVHGLPAWFFTDVDAAWPAVWTTSERGLRAWPLRRGDGDAAEVCGVDIDLGGAATVACLRGTLWAHGLDGVLRTTDGAFSETNDAGRSWQPLPVPRGWDAAGDHIACTAIGCGFGIYVRLGWGAAGS